MVEIFLDRTYSGSVATILAGDTIVVRVYDGPGNQCWTSDDSGLLTLSSTERVEGDGALPGERLLRFRATKTGQTTLRLALRGDGAHVVDTFVLAVEVHERPPPSAHPFARKRS
jgi:hypothetical protein